MIIPALISRGLTIEDARDYNIIGCVEPQKAGKTEGWHDAAFYNMCRPLELVFSNGMDKGVQIGPQTGDVTQMKTFEEFYSAYKTQMNYMLSLAWSTRITRLTRLMLNVVPCPSSPA